MMFVSVRDIQTLILMDNHCMCMANTDHQLATVRRTFEILELLWENGALGVTEVADRLGTHKSTAHGYLRTLEATGFIINDEGRYQLGLRFLEVGGRIKYRDRLFHIARPQLNQLAEDTGFTASLAVKENNEIVIAHLVHGERSLRLGIYPGMRIPLHSHAAGKSILAYSSEDVVDRFFASQDLKAVTEYTKTDPEAIRNEFTSIRDAGYACDWDEQVIGMGIVAAPIMTNESIYGAIGLVCPTNQLTDENQRAELAEQVKQTTNVVSINYQYGR
jgi:DNA-binding IclR family transcriptional regulator